MGTLFNYGKIMFNTVLVTAFFDIGRESYTKLSRSTLSYLEYFSRWARIKNFLFVFCGNEQIKNEVFKIRKTYNLENMTRIIVIENIYDIEADIYSRMKDIEKDKYFHEFRIEKNYPENIANYNYITNLKCWFLYKASLEENVSFEYAAWIDFGYDHGGKLFYDENDWSFALKANIDKVQLFYLPDKLEERPVFEVIRTIHPDSINGNLIICPKSSIHQLWICVREAIYNMLFLGLMDDDQAVLLLASRREPKLFNLRQCYWFLPVTFFGGEHMKLNNDFLYRTNTQPLVKRIYRKLKNIFLTFSKK